MIVFLNMQLKFFFLNFEKLTYVTCILRLLLLSFASNNATIVTFWKLAVILLKIKNIEILLEGDMWEFQIAHVWTFIFWICWSYFSYVHNIPYLFGQTISNFKHSGWLFFLPKRKSWNQDTEDHKAHDTLCNVPYIFRYLGFSLPVLTLPMLFITFLTLFFFFEINALFNACHHWRWQKFSWIPLCSAGLHVWGKMVCHLPMSALLMQVLLEYSRFSKQIIWDKRNLQ